MDKVILATKKKKERKRKKNGACLRELRQKYGLPDIPEGLEVI